MANPELGAKQICPTCSTKFYDLGRRPAHCPKCGAEFDPEEALRSRRVRTRAPLPEEEAEEVKPAAAEPRTKASRPRPRGAGTGRGRRGRAARAGDEDEEPPPTPPPPPDEALGVDFAEDEDLEDADDDEVPFIEDEDDDFTEDEIDGLPEGGRGLNWRRPRRGVRALDRQTALALGSAPSAGPLGRRRTRRPGAIAQLVERLNGIQEVSGSTPLSSTNFNRLG